jgi:hypothetical protein
MPCHGQTLVAALELGSANPCQALAAGLDVHTDSELRHILEFMNLATEAVPDEQIQYRCVYCCCEDECIATTHGRNARASPWAPAVSPLHAPPASHMLDYQGLQILGCVRRLLVSPTKQVCVCDQTSINAELRSARSY